MSGSVGKSSTVYRRSPKFINKPTSKFQIPGLVPVDSSLVTLSSHSLLRGSLSDCNQGLAILDQVGLFWRDLNAAPDCSTAGLWVAAVWEDGVSGPWSWPGVVTLWLVSLPHTGLWLVMARCCHPESPDIRDTEQLVTCRTPWHNPGDTWPMAHTTHSCDFLWCDDQIYTSTTTSCVSIKLTWELCTGISCLCL